MRSRGAAEPAGETRNRALPRRSVAYARKMIREVAILNVRAGDETEFEAAFAGAVSFIRATEGFIQLHLERCIETTSQYLLTVEWEALENHTVDFRQSDRYNGWKAALHHFYEPFPTVEHYESVLRVE